MQIRKIQRKKPRIAMVMDTWFPVHTGEQVYTAKLARALADEHGYEVDIFTRAISGHLSPEQKAFEISPAIRMKRFGWPSHPWNILMQSWFVLVTFFKLLLAGQRYKLYHAHTATSALTIKMASWFTRVPTLVTVHGNQIFDSHWTLRKVIHRIVFLETRYTQEISISESFLKAKNVNEPVLVVPYGVDLAPFDSVSSEKHPERFNVLYVGRLDIVKGLDVLLRATQKVIESNGFIHSQRDFQLHLAGNGPDRKMLEELADQLGISKYVRFHGLTQGATLIHLYKSCDLFVLPSRSEALPFSVLEACAARLPILATQVGDLKKLVVDTLNGHLAEPGDVNELAFYLEQFASNPALERMGQNSYDLVSQEYSWEGTVEKMLKIYEQVIQNRTLKQMGQNEKLLSPFRLPIALFRSRHVRKITHSKTPLQFCMTVRLARDNSLLEPFLERFTEFASQWEMPTTFFAPKDFAEQCAEELHALNEGGHEIAVDISKQEWLSMPIRKKALREARDLFEKNGLAPIRFMNAPLDLEEEDLELCHELGFDSLPVSEDPDLQIVWRWGIPFGRVVKMNLDTFVTFSNEKLLVAIERLRAYQKHNKISPFLIFEWDASIETRGEAFTELSKKLSFLKENFPLEFMTLSEFCKSCSIPS